MATATANRIEQVAEQNGTRLAAIVTPVAKFAGVHLTHVAVFILFVQARHLIALPIAARIEGGLKGAGVPVLDVIVHTWAVSFDAIWTFILALATTGQVL